MWNSALKTCATIIVASWLSGCVTTQATKFADVDLPPIPANEVHIFETLDDVPTEFVKVGYIYMQGSSTFTDEAQMMEAARKKAGKIGANAIVMREVKEASQGEKIAAAVFGWGTQRRGKVLAIYFDKGTSGSIMSDEKSEIPSSQRELKRSLISDESSTEPSTRLPYFRKAVKSAEKYSDEQILAIYRKKFPNLHSKTDEELIALIENKYKNR